MKKILLSVIQTYFQIRSWYPIWRMMNYRAITQRYPLSLDSIQTEVYDDLSSHGIAISHIDAFLSSDTRENLYAEVAALSRINTSAHTSKPFLEALIDAGSTLNFKDALTQFALHYKIRDVVMAYLDMRGKYYYHTLNRTNPVEKGAIPQKSQRWHRDPEDKKLCKIFLYLTDVDETAGPFMYIAHSAYGMKYSNVFPQRPPIGYYPKDGEVERVIDPKDIMTLTGKKGTLILCDTTGLHKGGYATEKERLMFTGGYKSPSSITPLRVKYPDGNNLFELTLAPKMRFSKALFRLHGRLSAYFAKDPYNANVCEMRDCPVKADNGLFCVAHADRICV